MFKKNKLKNDVFLNKSLNFNKEMDNKNISQKIIDFKLDTIDERIFYINFFKYFFKNNTKPFVNVSDFYNRIKDLQKPIESSIKFFPSVDFKFLEDYFLMKYLNVSLVIDFFKSSDFTPTVGQNINSFINLYKNYPLDIIYNDDELSQKDKDKKFRKLFKDLSQKKDYSKARFLKLRHYEIIRKSMQKSKSSFLETLRCFDLKRFTKFIDKNGKEIKLQKRIISKKSFNKKFYNNLGKHYILSFIRPWMKFDSIYIQSSESIFYHSNNFIIFNDQKYFEPSIEFHKEYIKNNGKQINDVFISSNDNSFKIIYKYKNEFFNQDEQLFAKEKEWNSYNIYMSSLKHLNKITKISNFKKYLIDTIKSSLHNKLNINFNINVIINLIISEFDYNLSIYKMSRKIFNIIGRLFEPMNKYHLSLLYKINNCYLKFENIMNAPNEILWPEYYSYSVDDQKLLSKNWQICFYNFYYSLLQKILKQEYNLNFHFKHQILNKVKIINNDLSENIYKDEKFIDLKSFDEDTEDEYIDFNFVNHQKEVFGVMIDYPIYWIQNNEKLDEKKDKEKDEKIEITEYITFNDIEDYIKELEISDEIKFIENELEEDDEEFEIVYTEEQRDITRDEDDDNLDDEILDIEDFLGSDQD